MVSHIIEALILSSALSLDAFIASFAYGSNRIRIPFCSIQIINLVCSAILGAALLAGSIVRQFLPETVTTIICFSLLFILGMMNLLDSFTKMIIRKNCDLSRKIKFSMFNFKFILNVYADPEKADVDASKSISPVEAASLAVALSLDGFAVGFGAALGNVNVWAVILCSLVTDVVAIVLGRALGERMARKMRFNLSWLSGAVLIVLAFMKL